MAASAPTAKLIRQFDVTLQMEKIWNKKKCATLSRLAGSLSLSMIPVISGSAGFRAKPPKRGLQRPAAKPTNAT
jgi:hypothetical protein